MGRVRYYGFGLKHSISQYFNQFPVEVAAGIYNQYFKLGTIIDARTWLFNIQGSYRFSIFDFYGGLGYETSTLNIEYNYKNDDGSETTQSFDLTGSNSVRLTAGRHFNFGPVKLNTDYSLASQSVFTIGLGIGFDGKNVENEK